MCTALDIQDTIAPVLFGEKEVKFDPEFNEAAKTIHVRV